MPRSGPTAPAPPLRPQPDATVRRHLIEGISQAIEALPGSSAVNKVEIARGGRDRRDAVMHVDLHGSPVVLVIETKKTAYPRDIREALWRFSSTPKAVRSRREVRIPFLAAQSLSSGARELLRAQNVGYFDSGGSLFIPAEGAYVFVDKPPTRNESRLSLGVFKGKSARIVHDMLVNPTVWFSANALAANARVAVSTVSRALIELERLDLVNSRGQGPAKERSVTDAKALLNAWANAVLASPAPALQRFFVPGLSGGASPALKHIAASFGPGMVDYAITHEAGAQAYKPFLTAISTVRVRAVRSKQLQAALSKLDARRVDEGFNFGVIEIDDVRDLFLGERVLGIPIASPIQVYLDLIRSEGRAKEMAEHLRREKIGF